MRRVLIELYDVCKSFGDKVLFDNSNRTIDTGESGCGKTTLLNMIGGLESVSKGKINVDGLDITNTKNLKKYYPDTVGFVFQNFALVEQKTVEENLLMVHSKGKSGIMVEEVLESVGMVISLKQKIYSLSGGEQQRIALARL